MGNILLGIAVVTSVIFIAFLYKTEYASRKRKPIYITVAAVSLTAFIACACGISMLGKANKRDFYDRVAECAENGYEVYMDGTPIEYQHISIRQYSVSSIEVHDEIREIHITAGKK